MAEKPQNASLPAKTSRTAPGNRAPEVDPKKQPQSKTDLEVFLLYTLPTFFKKRLDYLLFGLVILAGCYWFWNYRRTSAIEYQAALAEGSAIAWESLERGKSTGILTRPVGTEADVRRRIELATEIDGRVDRILGAGSDAAPEQKAKALLVRGELNLLLSQLPPDAWTGASAMSGSTTKPAAQYLADAERAYNQILTEHDKRPAQVMPALLALASIAETKGDLAAAERYYDMVLKDANAQAPHKQLAEARKAILPRLGVKLVEPKARPAEPATTVPSFQPTDVSPPSTGPTTAPAQPETIAPPPATSPSSATTAPALP